MVRVRTASTPARCHSQDGIRAQARAGGNTRMPRGAGPGAGAPYRYISVRQARCASIPTTFCSSTAGTSASSTWWLRPTRRPACRAAISRSSWWPGSKPARSSPPPSMSGRVASSHAAPGPQAAATITSRPGGLDTECAGAVRGQRRAPHGPGRVDAVGRVTAAPAVHGQSHPHVDRERRVPVPGQRLSRSGQVTRRRGHLAVLVRLLRRRRKIGWRSARAVPRARRACRRRARCRCR